METPDIPDSPEGVALALFFFLFAMVQADLPYTNMPIALWALDLYGQCLNAVMGDRVSHRHTH